MRHTRMRHTGMRYFGHAGTTGSAAQRALLRHARRAHHRGAAACAGDALAPLWRRVQPRTAGPRRACSDASRRARSRSASAMASTCWSAPWLIRSATFSAWKCIARVSVICCWLRARPGSPTCASSRTTRSTCCSTRSRRTASTRCSCCFPDPWPKSRHHKRRLVQPVFAALVASRLTPGGRLHLATDWEPYAESMLRGAQRLRRTAQLRRGRRLYRSGDAARRHALRAARRAPRPPGTRAAVQPRAGR